MFGLLRDIFWGLRHEQKPAPDVDHVRPSSVELPYDSQEAIALNVDGRLPILPPEIVEQIIIHAGRPLLPPRCAPYEEYFRVRKAYWKRLRGVVSSTRYYRQLLVKRWFAVVILREPCDWDRLQDTGWMGGLRPYITTVISAGGALTSSLRNRTDTKVLLSFDRLTRASLDFHNDFLKSSSSLPHYQLITNLPSSLEFLEILNAHGPDENMIKLASSCCPNLLELRLGRCTMFNNPNCVWWRAHPADHDAYMADRGVEAYAGAVGNLIVGMPRLHTLHIGVYLTPIEAVWAHRVDHRRYHPFPDSMRHENQEGIHNHLHQIALAAANGEDPDPPINYHYPPLAKKEIWEAPCVECEKRFRAPAEDAEMRTACVLSARVWSLRTVSFGSFTSQARTGCSAWQVRPRHSVEGYTLDGYHAAEMLPKVGQEDPPIRFVEVEVGRLDGPENAFRKRKILTFGISNFGNTIVISPPLNEPRISTIF